MPGSHSCDTNKPAGSENPKSRLRCPHSAPHPASAGPSVRRSSESSAPSQAFNQDKPYDQVLREQIAGDLLPASGEREKRENIIATGFVALSRRFGSDKKEQPFHLTIEDTLDTIGRSVMGLSMSCARCHDHKFDPISNADYYSLYGIFESTQYPFPGRMIALC